MKAGSLFPESPDDDSSPVVPRCPQCNCDRLEQVIGTTKYRCCECSWLIAITTKGKGEDALPWRTAGRKRGRK